MIRFVACVLVLSVGTLSAAEPDRVAAQRGQKALEQTAFIRGFWPTFAYNQAWKSWGLTEKPTDYDTAFRERYGLHTAPYANDKLPMGLRKADYLIMKGLGIDCMTCHGGSVMGKSVVGLGNSSLDIHALFSEMAAASGSPAKPPFHFSQARGTNEAGAFSVYLLGYRNDNLTLSPKFRELGLHDDSCEDVPAWWHLKKKKTMYYVGATDARSVRSIMQFMMHPLTVPSDFEKAEPAFRDILQYLLTVEPPKYPFAVNTDLAKTGEAIFRDNCTKCHGTYGEKWTYPNKIIPLDEIGTDRKRFDNISEPFGKAYNASWFAQEKNDDGTVGKPVHATAGYQAPPLDGIWATAPYFHNGSVPTLEGVLNSKHRPKIFTRSFHTNEADYDKAAVGWAIREVPAPDAKLPEIERRKVYDTTQPGRGNTGHTYGDDLTTEERHAVIEYLKTL